MDRKRRRKGRVRHARARIVGLGQNGDRFSYDSNFEIVFKTGAQHTKLVRTFLREVFSLYGISNLDIKRKRRRSVQPHAGVGATI